MAGNEVEEIVYKNGLLKDLGNIDDEQGQILEIFPNLWPIKDSKLLGGIKKDLGF